MIWECDGEDMTQFRVRREEKLPELELGRQRPTSQPANVAVSGRGRWARRPRNSRSESQYGPPRKEDLMTQFNYQQAHPNQQPQTNQQAPPNPPPAYPGWPPVQPHEPDRLKWRPYFQEDQTKGWAAGQQHRAKSSGLPVVVAMLLLAIAVLLVCIFHDSILTCLAQIGEIGQGAEPTTKGLGVLGVVLISILAAIRIVRDSSSNGR